MNDKATTDEAVSEEAQPGPAADKLTVDHVVRAGKRGLTLVGELPWGALGVLSAGVGTLVMYFYFRSLDHVPADFVTLLGAGVGIAGVTFAYLLAVMSALIVPHGVFTSSESLKSAPWRPWAGFLKDANNLLIGAQLLSVGMVFAYVTWGLWLDCVPGLGYVLAPAIVLVVVGGVIVVHAGWNPAVWRWMTAGGLVLLLLLSSLPLMVLKDLLMPTGATSGWDILLWLLTWLVFIFVLGAMPKEAPLWAVAMVVPFLLPAFLWLPPALRGHGDLFPQRVMELAGIRTATVVELKVPLSTCELIAATARFAPTDSAAKPCGTGVPWATVRAQVLSNLGTRWWIEVQQVGDLAVDPAEVLRMSIPADGTQLVQRRPTAVPGSRSQCKSTS